MFGSKKRKGKVAPNLVYKYRGGVETFERDLESLVKNYFWASSIVKLNDPCEGITTANKFNSQMDSLSDSISDSSKRKGAEVVEKVNELLSNSKLGIYALSKIYNDELLWAHYSNCHYGFCVEYDFNLLVDSFKKSDIFHFPIIYNNVPYDISIKDIAKIKSDSNSIVQKIIGYKSLRWEYEKEYRIVCDFSGKYSYDFRAVKSIYFGLRMRKEHKENIMNSLKGRGVKYFQTKLHPESYNFYKEEINDPNGSELTYLKYIPDFIIVKKRISYEIKEKSYLRFKKRGNIRIEIESTISNLELMKFATFIKDHLFQEAEKINMFYDLKGVSWATSHFANNEIKVNVYDFI